MQNLLLPYFQTVLVLPQVEDKKGDNLWLESLNFKRYYVNLFYKNKTSNLILLKSVHLNLSQTLKYPAPFYTICLQGRVFNAIIYFLRSTNAKKL